MLSHSSSSRQPDPPAATLASLLRHNSLLPLGPRSDAGSLPGSLAEDRSLGLSSTVSSASSCCPSGIATPGRLASPGGVPCGSPPVDWALLARPSSACKLSDERRIQAGIAAANAKMQAHMKDIAARMAAASSPK
ncbi:hypothetical protein DIPPA_09660 [Diplonema papillatum]|nr:hypothetical protein DIPPA_09660 [Diplonema papillatum]